MHTGQVTTPRQITLSKPYKIVTHRTDHNSTTKHTLSKPYKIERDTEERLQHYDKAHSLKTLQDNNTHRTHYNVTTKHTFSKPYKIITHTGQTTTLQPSILSQTPTR